MLSAKTKPIRKRSRKGGIAVQELRKRLESFSREDEERRLETQEAKSFFIGCIPISIIGPEDTKPLLLSIIKGMGDFVPLSLIDWVTADLADEARKAYDILLNEENRGNPEITDFWNGPRWKTFEVRSLRTRRRQIGTGEDVQFVFWVKTNNEARGIYDILEEEAPKSLEF